MDEQMKLTHSKLCEIAVKWLRKVKEQNCLYYTYPITGSEIACYNGVKWIEIPDAIGFNAYSSCVIECKMSRSDFFADQKKPFRTDGNGMGQKRFFLCPENLIKESDLPQGWGLLYVDEKMKVKEVKNSDTFDLNVDGLKAERLALVSIAKLLKKKEAGK